MQTGSPLITCVTFFILCAVLNQSVNREMFRTKIQTKVETQEYVIIPLIICQSTHVQIPPEIMSP